MRTYNAFQRFTWCTRIIATGVFFLLSSMTVFAQLSGDYTIGPGEDYTSITAACADLDAQGLSGPVVFNISAGIYTEQFTLPYIPTASETNTITFQSATGDASDVMVQYDAEGVDDNFIVKIVSGNFVRIRNISFKTLDEIYGMVIHLETYMFDLLLEGCRLEGNYDTNARARNALLYTSGSGLKDITIRNNRFKKGSYGMYLNCAANYNLRTKIDSNTFDSIGYTAIDLNKHEYTDIIGNEITYSGIGITLRGSSSSISVLSNRLSNITNKGIYLVNMTSAPGYQSYVCNNSVSLTEYGDEGVEMTTCSYINFYYNTVLLNTSNDNNAKVLYLNYCINPTINIINNNLVALDKGYCIFATQDNQVNLCDHNNYYTTGNYLAYWGEKCADLRTLKQVSERNEHSISAYPNFSNNEQPVPNSAWLDGAGTPVGSVIIDIDSMDRDDTHPDIGAWEFSAGAGTSPPMAGVYAIGNGADYSNLNDAVADLRVKGVADTVRLQFLPAYYEEQCMITPVAGASSTRPLILESSTGKREDVHLWYNAEDNDDNYVLYLRGASFLKLRNMSLHGMDARYARILELEGLVDSLEVVNCNFYGNDRADASAEGILVMTSDINFHHMRFANDSLFYGTTAIYMNNGQYPSAPGEFHFIDNYAENGYQNLQISRVHSLFIKHNALHSNTYGMYVAHVDTDLQITGNLVRSKYGKMLYLNNTGFENFTSGLIANNMMETDFQNVNYDLLSLYNCDHLDIYYNSISVDSDRGSALACDIQNSQDINLVNNIFYNQGTAYSFYTNNTTFLSANYNCYFNNGTDLAYWNSACSDLDALKTASGSNQHSVSADPEFTSSLDLHASSASLDGAGKTIAEIDHDFDGEARDQDHPDIGADEFGVIPNRAPVVDRSIPDQSFEWNTGPHDIARLDTVFSDPDGDALVFSAAVDVNWLLVQVVNDTLTLAMGEGASGTAEVVVAATDPADASVSDTFNVEVYAPENHPPVAVDDTVITSEAITIFVLENDYDEDGDALFVTGIDYKGAGNATLVNNTSILYTPAIPYVMKDSIAYFIADTQGARDTGMVLITLFVAMEEFVKIETDLPGLCHGSIKWGDYDNDGDLDLLQHGWEGTLNHYATQIIENTGDGFVDSGIQLTGLSSGTSGSAEWFDFDNDNDLDIVVTGRLDEDEFTKKSILYENQGGSFIEVENCGLTGVSSSCVSPADVDHDGKLDLLLSGSGENGDFTLIHMNGGTSFSSVETGLPGTHNGEAHQVDINNDGEVDVFLCGADIDPTMVYIAGADAYQEYQTIIPGMYNASADFTDLDGDGDQDVAIMGRDSDSTYLQIYLNVFSENNGQVFSLYDTFKGVESGDLAWADYDNDGDPDIAVTGNHTIFDQAGFILKNEAGTFYEVKYGLEELGRSSLDWGDFDNDGDLDLALQGTKGTGPQTIIYRYDTETENNPPVVIENFSTRFEDPYYIMEWDAATDDLTPASALTYNFRMGSTSQGTDIVSPASTGGFLKTPVTGNAGHSRQMKVLDPGPGTYYWSLQAIDQSFAASGFAMEATLVVTGEEDAPMSGKMKIYPNPMGSRAWITVPSDGIYFYEFIDVTGRKVDSGLLHVSGGEGAVDTGMLPMGSYVLKINNGSKTWQQKVVK